MHIQENIPLLEDIFSKWQPIIGNEYPGYRNHVYRMIHFCYLLKKCNEEEKQKIIIAAAFHDIGIWIENTVDYIPPSLPPAIEYLRQNDLEQWQEEIGLMISEHHKISRYQNDQYPLVELFRQGDLVDFSLGAIKFGLSKASVAEIKSHFSNEGFHINLAKRAGAWFLSHPFNPAPMMKW